MTTKLHHKSEISVVIFLLVMGIQANVASRNATSISCSVSLDSLQTSHPELKEIGRFVVQCQFCENLNRCYVFGTSFYTTVSGICCAAIHDGKISQKLNVSEVEVVIHNQKRRRFPGTTKNGVRSRVFRVSKFRYFSLADVAEPTTTSTINNFKAVTTNRVPTSSSTIKKPLTTVYSTTQGDDTTTLSQDVMLLAVQNVTIKEVNNRNPNGLNNVVVSDVAESTVTSLSASTKLTTNRIPISSSTIKKPSTMIYSPTEARRGTHLPKSSYMVPFYNTPVFQIFCGFALVLFVILAAVAVCHRYNRSRLLFRRLRIRRRPEQDEHCVCYVNPSSSRQELLNDPETCERPCSLREEKVLKICTSGVNSDCGDCTDKCDSSKFEY